MKKIAIISLILIVLATVPLAYPQQIDPQVSDANVESITVIQEDDFLCIYQPCSHFVYTFNLTEVNATGDKVYFSCWVATELVANWSIAFSLSMGLNGIAVDESTGLIQVHTIMAEFPYAQSEGVYSYRMHFYFESLVFTGAEVRIAADYMQPPTYQGSELTILRITGSYMVDDVEVFTFVEVPQRPWWWRLWIWMWRWFMRWRR